MLALLAGVSAPRLSPTTSVVSLATVRTQIRAVLTKLEVGLQLEAAGVSLEGRRGLTRRRTPVRVGVGPTMGSRQGGGSGGSAWRPAASAVPGGTAGPGSSPGTRATCSSSAPVRARRRDHPARRRRRADRRRPRRRRSSPWSPLRVGSAARIVALVTGRLTGDPRPSWSGRRCSTWRDRAAHPALVLQDQLAGVAWPAVLAMLAVDAS
ncbi:hypothetical protein HBB16_18430 [Pseudonocardia sp. MCCB 268]|nr:hypothetical protein [Pseudonocardia cytotoxica]